MSSISFSLDLPDALVVQVITTLAAPVAAILKGIQAMSAEFDAIKPQLDAFLTSNNAVLQSNAALIASNTALIAADTQVRDLLAAAAAKGTGMTADEVQQLNDLMAGGATADDAAKVATDAAKAAADSATAADNLAAASGGTPAPAPTAQP